MIHVARCTTFRDLLLTFLSVYSLAIPNEDEQSADSKPRSTRTTGTKHPSKSTPSSTKSLPLNNDVDEIAGSTGISSIGEPTLPGGDDAEDLGLYELLGEASSEPQRFSGGGLSTRRSSVPWKEPLQQSSYEGGQDLNDLGGPFDGDQHGSFQKAMKKEKLPTYLEVSDAGGCRVGEKDVDPKTVAALKDRGIEIFTPVQVLCCTTDGI